MISPLAMLQGQIRYADERYGPFTSAHEGYGVLCEEVAELLDAIRTNKKESIQREAIQVAAVAIRIVQSLENSDTARRSGLTE